MKSKKKSSNSKATVARLRKLRKDILVINKEINRMRHLICGLQGYSYMRMNQKTLGKKTKVELIKLLSMTRSLRLENKRKLIQARNDVMTLLIRLRKVITENYVMKNSLGHSRSFSHISYKRIISGSKHYNKRYKKFKKKRK